MELRRWLPLAYSLYAASSSCARALTHLSADHTAGSACYQRNLGRVTGDYRYYPSGLPQSRVTCAVAITTLASLDTQHTKHTLTLAAHHTLARCALAHTYTRTPTLALAVQQMPQEPRCSGTGGTGDL